MIYTYNKDILLYIMSLYILGWQQIRSQLF